MKKTWWCLICIWLVTGAGCAGPSPEPSLVDVTEFPPSRYLTARGLGSTETEARRQAMAAMANIFESRIYTRTYSKALSIVDADRDETFTRQVENDIRVESSVRLAGVQIGKTWQDPATGLHHAVAVLDRLQARSQWGGEIERIDARIQGNLKVLEPPTSKLERLQALNSIMSLWLKREAINSRLIVIGFPEVEGVGYDPRSVARSIAGIRSELRVYVVIDGDSAETLADKIRERLTRDGYRLTDSRELADVTVKGRLVVESVALGNPEVDFVRATATVSLLDGETGLAINEFREQARKGHINKKEAGRKAVAAVAAAVAENVVLFFGQIGGLPEQGN